jgi:hypothetical protein
MVDSKSIWPARKLLNERSERLNKVKDSKLTPPCTGEYDKALRMACNYLNYTGDYRCVQLRAFNTSGGSGSTQVVSSSRLGQANAPSISDEKERAFIRAWLEPVKKKAAKGSKGGLLSDAVRGIENSSVAGVHATAEGNATMSFIGGSQWNEDTGQQSGGSSSRLPTSQPTAQPSAHSTLRPSALPTLAPAIPPTEDFIAEVRAALRNSEVNLKDTSGGDASIGTWNLLLLQPSSSSSSSSSSPSSFWSSPQLSSSSRPPPSPPLTPVLAFNASFSTAATLADHCTELMDHLDLFYREENPRAPRGGLDSSVNDHLMRHLIRGVNETATITRSVMRILTGPELPPEPSATDFYRKVTDHSEWATYGANQVTGTDTDANATTATASRRDPSASPPDRSPPHGSGIAGGMGSISQVLPSSNFIGGGGGSGSAENSTHLLLRVAVCITGNLRSLSDFEQTASPSFMKNFWRPGYDVFLVVGDTLPPSAVHDHRTTNANANASIFSFSPLRPPRPQPSPKGSSPSSLFVTAAPFEGAFGAALRGIKLTSIGDIRLAGDPHDRFGQLPCRHYDPPRLNHLAMIGQFLKFPLAYRAMTAEEARGGFAYDFVVRARPDLVYLHPFPRIDHFFEQRSTYNRKADKRDAFGGPKMETSAYPKADVLTFDDQVSKAFNENEDCCGSKRREKE